MRSGSGGLALDQDGGDDRGSGRVARDPLHQAIDHQRGALGEILADGRERGRGVRGQRDVVIADHRGGGGDVDPGFGECAQHAHCGDIGRGEDAVEVAGNVEELGAGPGTAVLGEVAVGDQAAVEPRGVQPLGLGNFSPTLRGFITLTPLLLFAFLGFEGGSSASGEMRNAQHDVSVSVLRSATMAGIFYLLPVATILLVLPPSDIDGVSGLLKAVNTVFSVYGPAAEPMMVLALVMFTLANIGQGAAWMIMSDRMQAMAAADGSFFGGFFGKFHPRLGTPVHVNLLSGIVSTLFMLAAMELTGSSADLFNVVLGVAVTTYLFSYLLIIPAAAKLRLSEPDVERPFRAGPNWFFILMCVVTTTFVAFGSWVSIFPGTLEALVGMPHDFSKAQGVSYASFEALTLGTLAFIIVMALIGYWRGAPLRRSGISTESLNQTSTEVHRRERTCD